ncbi:MAG: Low specificity L-threonine aldolase, partial [Actinomycetota bacterium]
MNTVWRGFASDNYAAAHPAVIEAIINVNQGHQVAYGEDDSTKQLQSLIKEHFGAHAEVFPVFNGTGSNVAALSSLMERWEA